MNGAMVMNRAFSTDQIEKALESAKKARPVYSTLLDFYGKVFIAQEESKGAIRLDPIAISGEVLSAKLKEGLPMAGLPDFKIDMLAAADLLVRLCRMAVDANPQMAESAKCLQAAVESGQTDLRVLFDGLLNEDDALFESMADSLNVDKQILAFMVYTSMNPSITLCADQLATYLKEDEPREERYCPICGNSPAISTLEGDGERFLFCGFCWHKWPTRRIECAYCGTTDSKKLHYFYNEEEKEYRVDVCDACGKYIKTVDTRKTDRLFYPPLEQVTTLHLDIRAREKGLESGSYLPFSI